MFSPDVRGSGSSADSAQTTVCFLNYIPKPGDKTVCGIPNVSGKVLGESGGQFMLVQDARQAGGVDQHIHGQIPPDETFG